MPRRERKGERGKEREEGGESQYIDRLTGLTEASD